MFHLSAKDVAKIIKIPVKHWPGNCYAIATAMVKANVVRGKPTYGHYHGFISDLCDKFGGRPFTHHGWITRKTTIVDPTRWVFEARDPYIYVGPKDNRDYDMGGNELRKIQMQPFPEFNKEQDCWSIPPHLHAFVQHATDLKLSKLCAVQVAWLANLPIDMLGEDAKSVFLWIINDVGFSGMIPIDNRLHILGK